MKPTYAAFIAPVLLVALTGCASEVAGEEAVGVGQEAALSSNALSSNALSSNALSSNALSSNALSSNALSSNALAAIQDPSPTGDLFRQLVKYTVGCALNSSQSFIFSWTDASGTVHQEDYLGGLGLAPEWGNGPLNGVNKQQRISACLAARTNYFGVTVNISVRGDVDALLENTSAAELAAFPYVEGAFWGNLFASTPALYACDNTVNAAHSDADLRVCTTGYVDANGNTQSCGMIQRMGSCDAQCAGFDSTNQLYYDCGGSSNALTIGLQ